MKVEKVALRFVDAIHGADLEGLAALMTDDHVFVDSDGSRIVGRESVLEAWSAYLSMMSDYRVDVQEIFSSEDTVVLIGRATGTFTIGGTPDPASCWVVPAAWRAVVESDRVAVWQVFVNPEPILAAARNPTGCNTSRSLEAGVSVHGG
jgi:uncharacterized protein (TIGR02246 family)